MMLQSLLCCMCFTLAQPRSLPKIPFKFFWERRLNRIWSDQRSLVVLKSSQSRSTVSMQSDWVTSVESFAERDSGIFAREAPPPFPALYLSWQKSRSPGRALLGGKPHWSCLGFTDVSDSTNSSQEWQINSAIYRVVRAWYQMHDGWRTLCDRYS